MSENTPGNTALVVSSSSSIEYTGYKIPANMYIIRQLLFLEDVVYRDVSEFEPDKMVEWMHRYPDLIPRTAGSDENDIAELSLQIEKKGFKDALFINPSGLLSKTNQTVVEMTEFLAKRMQIETFDTGSITVGELLFVVMAEKLINEGQSIQSVLNVLHTIKENTELYILLDETKYFAAQGRMSKFAGFLTSILDIKPFFRVKNGEVTIIEKIRKSENALKYFVDYVNEKLDKPNTIGIGMYTGRDDLKEFLLKNINPEKLKGEIPSTPGIAAHIGLNAVGIAIHYHTDQYLPKDFKSKF